VSRTHMENRCSCLLARRRPADARRYALHATEVYPGEAQAHGLLGAMALERRDYEEGLREFRIYDTLLPGNPDIVFYRGYCADHAGHRGEAAQAYRNYLQSGRRDRKAAYARSRLAAWGFL